MRKRTKVHDTAEEWIDSLSDADRWRLYQAIMAERRKTESDAGNEPRTLH